jgi:hypothetical protein
VFVTHSSPGRMSIRRGLRSVVETIERDLSEIGAEK